VKSKKVIKELTLPDYSKADKERVTRIDLKNGTYTVGRGKAGNRSKVIPIPAADDKEHAEEYARLAKMEAIRAALEKFFSTDKGFGAIDAIDYTDGIRIFFANGEIAHLRPSGNAPQFRIYSVAGTAARAEEIVNMGRGTTDEDGQPTAADGILRDMIRWVRGADTQAAKSASSARFVARTFLWTASAAALIIANSPDTW
jgi:hypothetical protein